MDEEKAGLTFEIEDILSEGREFQDLAAKQENERSPLVL